MRLRELTVVVFIFSLSGCTQSAAPATMLSAGGSLNTGAALPLRATIDFGVIFQRESAKLNCWIRNQGKESIDVSMIRCSCECLKVSLSKVQIAPGARTLAQFHYDGAKEPDFVGCLQLEVELIDHNGAKVGQIEVPIEVIRANIDSK